MFMAALFIMAKQWKSFKCPSTNKWINKMWLGLPWWLSG